MFTLSNTGHFSSVTRTRKQWQTSFWRDETRARLHERRAAIAFQSFGSMVRSFRFALPGSAPQQMNAR